MTKVGIIGSGAIGGAIARLAVAAGHDVVLSNSRGPASLTELVADLGARAAAAETHEAAAFGDVVVLAVPLAAYDALPTEALAGKAVLSTGNYYPSRDGRIPDLDSASLTTAQHEQRFLPGVALAKAFNNIVAQHIEPLARRAGAPDRSGLAVAADDAAAKAAVSALVDSLGFDPVDAGTLAQSCRFEPESGAYTTIYAADRDAFAADWLADPGAPLPAERLRDLLAASHRPDVAGRKF